MKKIISTLAFFFLSISFCFPQWQPDMRLTNDTASSETSYNNAWCVGSGGSYVHIVWSDNRDGNYEIYYKRSSDNGISWGADTRLTNNSFSSTSPSISVYSSYIHILWTDNRDGNNEIYYKRSTDNGVTWGADTRLTNNSFSSLYPSIVAYSSNVYIAWCESNLGANLYFNSSSNWGVTWDTAVSLLFYNFTPYFLPSIAVSSVCNKFRSLHHDYLSTLH